MKIPPLEDDKNAYAEICQMEVLFRRIIRWELSGRYGRAWVTKIGDELYEKLQNNIEFARKEGNFNSETSVLTYLFLSDLINFMFRDGWHVFSEVFDKKRDYQKELGHLKIIRNKVAHFNPLNSEDLEHLADVRGMIEKIKEHYLKRNRSAFYVSGEWSSREELSREKDEEIKDLADELSKRELNSVWSYYESLNHLEADGISAGLGLLKKHCFLELFNSELQSFHGDALNAFAESSRYEITFLCFGQYGHYARLFIPLAPETNSPKDIKKTFKKFVEAAERDVADGRTSPMDIVKNYRIGSNEVMIADTINSAVHFGF